MSKIHHFTNEYLDSLIEAIDRRRAERRLDAALSDQDEDFACELQMPSSPVVTLGDRSISGSSRTRSPRKRGKAECCFLQCAAVLRRTEEACCPYPRSASATPRSETGSHGKPERNAPCDRQQQEIHDAPVHSENPSGNPLDLPEEFGRTLRSEDRILLQALLIRLGQDPGSSEVSAPFPVHGEDLQ